MPKRNRRSRDIYRERFPYIPPRVRGRKRQRSTAALNDVFAQVYNDMPRSIVFNPFVGLERHPSVFNDMPSALTATTSIPPRKQSRFAPPEANYYVLEETDRDQQEVNDFVTLVRLPYSDQDLKARRDFKLQYVKNHNVEEFSDVVNGLKTVIAGFDNSVKVQVHLALLVERREICLVEDDGSTELYNWNVRLDEGSSLFSSSMLGAYHTPFSNRRENIFKV